MKVSIVNNDEEMELLRRVRTTLVQKSELLEKRFQFLIPIL